MQKERYIGLIMTVLALVFANPVLAISISFPNDTTFYQQYPYIHILQEGEKVSITDEEFFDKSGKVVFPVNVSTLPADDALLTELVGKVIPQIHRDSLQLLRVMLRGAASPEGPYENNRLLGERRAKALIEFLQAQLGEASVQETLSSQVDIEDYRSLCLMMQRAADPDHALVQELCDTHLPSACYEQLKQELKKAKGGTLWPRLLKDYFPQLRAVRLMLFLRQLPPPPAPEPVVEEVQPVIEPMPVAEPDSVVLYHRLARRELLSIKTNVLYDVAYMPGYNRWCPIPNVAIEYYPKKGHFTYGASFDCPWWTDYSSHKFFEVRNYQVETRYYLKAGDSGTTGAAGAAETAGNYKAPAFRGFYLQAYAHAGLFEIGFDADRGWKGEGMGAGLGLGYVTSISRNGHWRLEFGLQVGWFGCKYDPFQYENLINPDYHDDLYYYRWRQDASLFRKRQYRFNWVGPTRIGITLSYDLLYRRQAKRGISFKAYESYQTYESYENYKAQERRTAP